MSISYRETIRAGEQNCPGCPERRVWAAGLRASRETQEGWRWRGREPSSLGLESWGGGYRPAGGAGKVKPEYGVSGGQKAGKKRRHF